ncbi:MAG: acetoacetate--CoA ligase [Candidatus Dormibacteria bacterium]
MPARAREAVLWEPGRGLVDSCRLTDYTRWLRGHQGLSLDSYADLWSWSVGDLDGFWSSILAYFEVADAVPGRPALARREMPFADWFPDTHLNYAQQALRRLDPEKEAVVAYSEAGSRRALSGAELARQVAALTASLAEAGVGRGDRVAGYLPNVPEAVVACLATAARGAIWSSCSPDFGEPAVLDRFRQIEPLVLVAADGYRYGGRAFDRRQTVASLRRELPSVRQLITVATLEPEGGGAALPGARAWAEVASAESLPSFAQVPFQHPLWVLYSSGTTGLPKPIVHGHGGMVLEHLKALALHADIGPASRFFWFSTTGWMMWNYLLSGLLLGSQIVLYDGSPIYPDPARLWRLAGEAEITHFGTSAAHITASQKAGLHPAQEADLAHLRFVGSTGSPLPPEGFDWVYREVKSDVWLSSLSGGTDMCTAFLLGCPWLPVRRGVIQCRGLGAKVEAWDEAGQAQLDRVGELVITEPMPSMPVCLWGDRDGSRYRESYFATYPGVWRHGDWVRLLPNGGAVISGRSDSTINRHGVRIGTSEIYRAVEGMDEVADSLVVDLETPTGGVEMLLFVVLAPPARLTAALERAIRARLRADVSPRHVPDHIVELDLVPRTLSGKKLEVPVKRILMGAGPEAVANLEAIQDPRSLEQFVGWRDRRAAEPPSGSGL